MKFILSFLLISSLCNSQDYQKHVNPFIGTGGHGHTFPGATVPFGMVQLSPDTRIDGSWDGCSGYHYSDDRIYGFSHTHLNGTGVSDFGDIMLMPTMGDSNLDPRKYSSLFSHINEKASAGYYAVKLDDNDIDVELTTSTRVGFHRYKFNQAGQANIVLDLNHRDKLLQGEVRIVDDCTIEILRRSEAWARDQYVFARLEFDRPMQISSINNNAFAPAKVTDSLFAGSILSLAFSSMVQAGDVIMVKVALSPTGFEGAERNMSEIAHWDFDQTVLQAKALWNKELSKIEITSSDKDKLAIFYTALYHTMIQPNIAEDIDGKYRGRDNRIHLADKFDYYTVFSLWDTFRAAHPLYTLIDKKRTADFINTFIAQYEQGGTLPVWELSSNETGCMIGYHSVSVIADAMAKGITGFDYRKAYQASKHSAMLDHLGMEAYKKNGFISIDDEHESVSKTLEYGYDDWCIAQMAVSPHINSEADYHYFSERAQSWKNIFDYELKFMRPKRNGGWDSPFDPREVNNNFTEGNSWHYSFFVPHDISGMISAYGYGINDKNAAFEAKLDELFSAPNATTGREQVDITGLIGQYAQGNEPSHHMAYLYNYVGKPEKTKEKIHFILNEFYKNSPAGLIGNEDCGQMSAWYILSSIGIYPIAPGRAEWTVTQPFFDRIRVNFEDKSSRTITKSTRANELKHFGFDNVRKKTADLIVDDILPVPVITSTSKAFEKELFVDVKSYAADSKIYFRFIANNQKESKFKVFTKPVKITESGNFESYIEGRSGARSKTVSAFYHKKPNNYVVELKSGFNKQYHAGGAQGLTDGIFGSENWRKGDWQGYQSQDFECIVDLKKSIAISEVTANFLQDTRSWIFFPQNVDFYSSADGKDYTLLHSVGNSIAADDYKVQVAEFSASASVKARFIKVVARNYGKLPEWHQGFGGDAFIFIDEITVK